MTKSYQNPSSGLKNAGFTLIELLVVVLIIGILSAVALPQYEKAVLKSRAAEALTNLRALETAQIAFYLANGVYTADISQLDVEVAHPEAYGCSISAGSFCNVTVRKGNGLWFEFVWPQPSWPEGQHRCIAPQGNETAIQICKSYGGVLMREESDNLYYVMNQ